MTNEEYLIISYFTVGILCVALSVLVYVLLRDSFYITVSSYYRNKLPIILKRLFLIGILFSALIGFFSVSYTDCKGSYQGVISERAFLVEKSQAQLSAVMLYIVVAIIMWSLMVAVILMIRNKKGDKAG